MGIYAIKPKFQNALRPVAGLFIKIQIHPTYINLLGLMISLLMAFSLFMASTIPAAYWVLPVGAFLRTACNALDGMVARGLNVSSAVGEVYNEFMDRISDAAIFFCVGLSHHGEIALAFAATIAILINSYLGIIGKAAGGSRVYIGLIGKADRMILLGAMGIISFFTFSILYWNIFLIMILSGTCISMIQRLAAIKKELTK
jgi:CDP-diacylglycerol---glycerol-3-phosphate 3-phosphatidyltransferase